MPFPRLIYRKLESIVGEKGLTQTNEDRLCYSYDATKRKYLPDAVIFPEHCEHVSAILKLANKYNFVVVPRGAGSGMTGGALPIQGGLVMAMTHFDRILTVDLDNLVAVVEPGVITAHLHQQVEKHNLFYPPDPASSEFSSIGGNVAECAGGPRAVKYGVTRDYVLGLEVVLPTGEIIKTGVQTAKGVVGYDLTRLFVGSEGTLGIFTKIFLRLIPRPQSKRTVMVLFKSMENAAKTVSDVISQGILPCTIEFIDEAALFCVESHLKMGLPKNLGAMLLIEVDGHPLEVAEVMAKIKVICEKRSAIETKEAETQKEVAQLWQARKSISPALYRYGPDKINEDIVVPRSQIPSIVRKISEMRHETGLMITSFGHAGDGNIHLNIMLNKKNSDQLKKANYAIDQLIDYTLALGGTISGEHGIGITKSRFIRKEIGRKEIQLMGQLKRLFDPNGILNPGKIF